MLNITMPRGDIRPVTFIVNGSEGITFDEIYFTVKRSFTDKNALFQKTLTSGKIEEIDTSVYKFIIESEDTDGLNYGRYVFDIELISGQDIKQTTVGELVLTNEVTFVTNEV